MLNEIKVLDKGFVIFKGCMDGDMGVVDAARVSYKSEAKTEDENRKLIAYLLKHNHGTPLEHAVFKFHVKSPLFVARQWFRHRMASYNETSFRYREAPEEFYIPEKWRTQDVKNKQGSIVLDDSEYSSFSESLVDHCKMAKNAYDAMLRAGVAREQARMVLPVNLYTEFYWTVNARSLMNFVGLRSDNHAQWEMRQYSHALATFFRREMPWTFGAFFNQLFDNKDCNYSELGVFLQNQYGVIL